MPQVLAPSAVRSLPDVAPAENRTLGWSILDWTSNFLEQPDGPDAGQPWTFTDEQVRIVLRWYAIDDGGRWLYRRGVIRRMKGWGKDPLAAALAAAELCGPCRFDGFDARGMPVAIPHPAPWIQVAAVSQDQTKTTMTLFGGMLTPAAIDEYRIDIGKTIVYARGGARIEAVTASPRALEGPRTTFVVKNETHHWITANDGIAMNHAIARNNAKGRGGAARDLEITNAHQPTEDSVAERTYEAWRAAEGNLPGVYYDAVEAPPIEDLADLDAVRAGLFAARGDSVWLDVDRLVGEISDPTTPAYISRRFYLNQVVNVRGERWMPMDLWDARKAEVDVAPRSDIVLAFDGSFSGDSTVLVGIRLERLPSDTRPGVPPHLFVVDAWETDGTPDWRVPVEDVEDSIRAACRRWRVREIVADPYRWARSLEILAKERLPVVEFPQSPQRMIPATKRLYDAVCDAEITQSGDADLRRHVENAVAKVSTRGTQLAKDGDHSPRKIDLAVAAVMGLDAAQRHKIGGAMVVDPNELFSDAEVLTFDPFAPDVPTTKPPEQAPADLLVDTDEPEELEALLASHPAEVLQDAEGYTEVDGYLVVRVLDGSPKAFAEFIERDGGLKVWGALA